MTLYNNNSVVFTTHRTVHIHTHRSDWWTSVIYAQLHSNSPLTFNYLLLAQCNGQLQHHRVPDDMALLSFGTLLVLTRIEFRVLSKLKVQVLLSKWTICNMQLRWQSMDLVHPLGPPPPHTHMQHTPFNTEALYRTHAIMYKCRNSALDNRARQQSLKSYNCMPDEACDGRNIALKFWVTVGVLDCPKQNFYIRTSACLISFMTAIMYIWALCRTQREFVREIQWSLCLLQQYHTQSQKTLQRATPLYWALRFAISGVDCTCDQLPTAPYTHS